MINIISVNPTGMFSYGKHATIELADKGLVLLEGQNLDKNSDSNGSGKTSTFNALAQILFGKNPTGHTGDAILNRKLGKCFGMVKFQTDAGLYRIIETRKWKKSDGVPDSDMNLNSLWINGGESYSGTDLFLERWDDGQNLWLDERATNIATGNTRLDMKATRKKILDILNISYDQYMAVAYLAQQQSLKFLVGGHKERMEILGEIIDISSWDRRIAAVRADMQANSHQIANINAIMQGMSMATEMYSNVEDKTTEQIDAEIAAETNSAAQYTMRSASLSKDLEDRKAAIAAATSGNAEIFKAVREMSSMLEVFLSLRNEEFKKHTEILRSIRETKQPKDIDNAELEVAQLKTQLHVKIEEVGQLMTGGGRCGKCKTVVDARHIQRHKDLLGVDINRIKAEIEAAELTLTNLKAIFNAEIEMSMNAASAKYDSSTASLTQNIETIKQQIAELDATIIKNNESARRLQIELDAMRLAENIKINNDNSTAALLRVSALGQARAQRAERERKSAEVAAATAANTARRAELLAKGARLAAIDRLFGDKGMKAARIDSALIAINQLLTDSIAKISDNTLSVFVSKTREKADGGTATDITITVKELNKDDVPYELYSGGEKQQIILAFVTAFWSLATKYGTGVNILCLDEIFGPLDSSNTNNMFEFLEYMRDMGKSSIFIVTHNKDVKKSMTFDEKWVATKQYGVTTLDVGNINE